MYIDVYIDRVVDSSGKGVAYCPTVHYGIDDADTQIDMMEMGVLCKTLAREIEAGINRAMKKRSVEL